MRELHCICMFALCFYSVKTGLVVVTSTETNEIEKNENNTENIENAIPKMYSMEIDTNIANRYAKTVVNSKVKNMKKTAAETSFLVILPENAFISEFFMEIDGKVYKAYVKEKEEAKQIYNQAVSSGQSAAHVEVSARDSKKFRVSVNLEPESKAIFQLTYEELLSRDRGLYEYVLNIHPGQIVPEMNIRVLISESRPLKSVQTPALRSGNEQNKNSDQLKPQSNITFINENSAVISYSPDEETQRSFAELLGTEKENGLAGQFVVEYDVERDPYGGEILIRDGYFVHFFSPSDLEPLPKHIVFVLDHSGSMAGNKMNQLIEAMKNILSDLREDDLFNIVRFGNEAAIWDLETSTFLKVPSEKEYEKFVTKMQKMNRVPEALAAVPENIAKAKVAIEDQSDLGLTNILSGLQTAMYLVSKTRETTPQSYQPMIIFLTDGLPNSLSSSTNEITSLVTKVNSGENRTSIFSLSLGRDADKTFLKRISLKNLGFSRHIYEAADTSIQLEDFYKRISSPLLNNITFKYVEGVKGVTKAHYPILFKGSELVVAGKLPDGGAESNVSLYVKGMTKKGSIQFIPNTKPASGPLERLWVYMTLKEIFKEREIAANKTEFDKKALELALKYSFVTEVSSLVVVKPNGTESSGNAENLPEPQPSQRSAWASALAQPIFAPKAYNSYYMPNLGTASVVGRSGMYGSGSTLYHMRFGSGPSWTTGISQYHIPRPSPPPAISWTSSTPDWLEAIKNGNQTVQTPQGDLKLGYGETVTQKPTCNNPAGGPNGTCTLLYECRSIFSKIPDFNTYYSQYFCNLNNEYAGVCCDSTRQARIMTWNSPAPPPS